MPKRHLIINYKLNCLKLHNLLACVFYKLQLKLVNTHAI